MSICGYIYVSLGAHETQKIISDPRFMEWL